MERTPGTKPPGGWPTHSERCMSDLAEFLTNHEGNLDWLEHALCSTMEISDFFVEAGHTINQEVINVCRMCPVRESCIRHAYQHGISGGYFGGISHGQRREMDLEKALSYAKKDVIPPSRVTQPRKRPSRGSDTSR